MKRVAPIALLLLLAGCGATDDSGRYDIHAIQSCARQHPPPAQAHVPALGLIPAYLTRNAGSDDAATKQWFADMDSCTAQYKPASAEKAK